MSNDISPEAAKLAHEVTPSGWHGTIIDAALRQAKEDGWNEGYLFSCNDHRNMKTCGHPGAHGHAIANPYRVRA